MTEMTNTDRVMFSSSNNAIATKQRAECESVSPK